MNDKILIVSEEIRVARNNVADAESVLVGLLKSVAITSRAEKREISEALHAALQKVCDVRDCLAKLETMMRRDEG